MYPQNYSVMAGPPPCLVPMGGESRPSTSFSAEKEVVDGRDVKLVPGPAEGRTRGHGHDDFLDIF